MSHGTDWLAGNEDRWEDPTIPCIFSDDCHRGRHSSASVCWQSGPNHSKKSARIEKAHAGQGPDANTAHAYEVTQYGECRSCAAVAKAEGRLKFGSVSAGIEAASVGWGPLGFEAQWFSEIAPFPSTVLARRYPNVPNLGDMTKIHDSEVFNGSDINVLVGGTPCPSYSIAGPRGGLDDPRGELALVHFRLARLAGCRWVLWENVPGVLSSNGGRDFGTLLRLLEECGYGWAYRTLDAHNFGSPAYRRRVFVVGYLGDWRRAAAVLFDEQSLRRNPALLRKVPRTIAVEDADRALEAGKPALLTMRAGKPGGGKGPLIRIDKSGTLSTVNNQTLFIGNEAPRKISALEHERILGFPDGYTEIEGFSEADRTTALGNSMDVRVMAWIGARIKAVDSIPRHENCHIESRIIGEKNEGHDGRKF